VAAQLGRLAPRVQIVQHNQPLLPTPTALVRRGPEGGGQDELAEKKWLTKSPARLDIVVVTGITSKRIPIIPVSLLLITTSLPHLRPNSSRAPCSRAARSPSNSDCTAQTRTHATQVRDITQQERRHLQLVSNNKKNTRPNLVRNHAFPTHKSLPTRYASDREARPPPQNP
jgi:hypothetical protein